MLWQQMSVGYQRCLQAQLDGEKQLNVVEVCERCLRYSQLQIFEYLQACYEVDAVLWQQLHALYYFTEEPGIQAQEIRDDHSLHLIVCSVQNFVISIHEAPLAKQSDMKKILEVKSFQRTNSNYNFFHYHARAR